MICKRCGTKVSDNSKFCKWCGTPVTEEDKGEPANEVKIMPDDEAKTMLIDEVKTGVKTVSAGRVKFRPADKVETTPDGKVKFRTADKVETMPEGEVKFRTDDKAGTMPDDRHTGDSHGSAGTQDNFKTIRKIILLALEICFFLPFCTISCGGSSITITGLTATIGNSNEDIAPVIYPAILFLMPLIALILIFKNGLNRTAEEERLSDNFSLATGIVDLAILLIFYIHVTAKVGNEIGSDSVSEVLSFKFGYVLEVLFNIALVALLVYQRKVNGAISIPGGSTKPEFVENVKNNVRNNVEHVRNNFEGKNIGDSVNPAIKENMKQFPILLIVSVAIFIFTAVVYLIQNNSEWGQWFTGYYYIKLVIEGVAVACMTYITLRENNKTVCIIIQAAYIASWLVQHASEFSWNIFGSIVAMLGMTIVWLIGWFIRNHINEAAWKPLFAIGVTSIVYAIAVPAIQYRGFYFSWYTVIPIVAAVIAFVFIQMLYKKSGSTPEDEGETAVNFNQNVAYLGNVMPVAGAPGQGAGNKKLIKIIIICAAAAVVIGAAVFVALTLNKHNDTELPQNDEYGYDDSYESDNSYDNTDSYSYEQYPEDFIFYDSSSRYLEDYEVSSLSDDDIQMAINEIYARHGVNFENEPYASYFNSREWYSPIYSQAEFDTSWFNEYEEANVNLLAYYRNNNTGSGDTIINSENEAMEYALDYARNEQGLNADHAMIESSDREGYTVRGYEDMGDHINTVFLWTVSPNGDIYDEQNWYWVYQN